MSARSKARKRALDILFASELRREEPVVALDRAIELHRQVIEEAAPGTDVRTRSLVNLVGALLDRVIAWSGRGWKG